MRTPTLGLVCSSAGGVEEVRSRLIEPMLDSGWRVAVTATPTAARWLEAAGEVDKIEAATGYVVRESPRLPSEVSPHPDVDCFAVVPATANTVAKLALGVGDNQALSQLCEAIGARRPPVIVFPRVNAAHAGHPAWQHHLDTLRDAEVQLVYGGDDWPLYEPHSAVERQLPWQAIRQAIEQAVTTANPAAT